MNAFGYDHHTTPSLQSIAQDVQSLARLLVRNTRLSQGGQGKSALSNAMIQVLTCLNECGPHAVPRIARRLSVGRQHIQRTVNDLLARDLVVRLPNPDHQRSWIIDLTNAGRFMLESEEAEPLSFGENPEQAISENDLIICQSVLNQLRHMIKPTVSAPPEIKQKTATETVTVSQHPPVTKPELPLAPALAPQQPPKPQVLNWNKGSGLSL